MRIPRVVPQGERQPFELAPETSGEDLSFLPDQNTNDAPIEQPLDLPDKPNVLELVHNDVQHLDSDHAAKVFSLSDQTGATPTVVAKDIPSAEKLINQPKTSLFDEIEKQYPGTNQFLQVPQNMAVAKDDIHNLRDHEGLINWFSSAAHSAKNALESGAIQEELGFRSYNELVGDTQNNKDFFRSGGFVAGLEGLDTTEKLEARAAEIDKEKPEGSGVGNYIKRGLYGTLSFAPQVAGAALYGAKDAAIGGAIGGAAGLLAGSVGASAGARLGAGTGFKVGEMEYNFKFMSGLAYRDLKKITDTDGNPLPDNIARTAALLTGGAASGLSLVQLGAVMGPLGKKVLNQFVAETAPKVLENSATYQTALLSFAKNYASNVAHFTGAMTGITAANIAGREGAKIAASGVDDQGVDHQYNSATTGEMLGELGTAANDALLTGAFAVLPNSVPSLAHELNQARVANNARDFTLSLNDLSQQSKLKKRLGPEYQKQIDAIAKDGPVENVHIPVEALTEYFQSKNIDPAVAMNELGVSDSFNEATKTGGDVQIPLGTWAEKMAGTEHAEGLSRDVKYHPEDLTLNEVEQRKSQVESDYKNLTDDNSEASVSANKVYQDVEQQLISAGRSEEEAKAGADLQRAFFGTLAARIGKDPLDLYKERGLQIKAGDNKIPDWPGSTPTEKKEFNQSKLPEIMKTLFQGNDGDKRGRIRFGKNVTLVDLFKNADQSTFAHESAHLFLETVGDIANDPAASDQIKQDYQTTLDYLGVKSRDEIQTEHHETFARSFESYLKDGQAPSEELQGVFSRMKKWLTSIYQRTAQLGVNVSPEMKAVFDRMLATDKEINEAQSLSGLNETPIDQAPEETQKRIKTLQDKAREIAVNTLLKPQMEELTKERREFLAKERDRATLEAKKEVSESPLYKAIEDIRVKLKRKNLGDKAEKFLNGKLNDKSSIAFEVAAELHGFEDSKILAEQILDDSKNNGFNKKVETLVDLKMDQHKDLMNKEDIKLKALEAIHSDQMTEVLSLEHAALLDLARNKDIRAEISKRRRQEARVDVAAAKAQAEEILNGKNLRQSQDFKKYVTAERNAAIKVQKALAKGDYEKAAQFKREQMLNHQLVQIALNNRKEVAKNLKYLTQFLKRGRDLLEMPLSFNKQVDSLLERFGLKEKSEQDIRTLSKIADDMVSKGESANDIANETGLNINKGVWAPETLVDFVKRVNDENYAMTVPDSVYDGSVSSYKDLTFSQMSDLRDAVQEMAETGKNYNKFLSFESKVDMREAARLFKESVEKNIRNSYQEKKFIGTKNKNWSQDKIEAIKNLPDTVAPLLVNILTLTNYLDRGDVSGFAKEFLYRPAKAAEGVKLERQQRMVKEVAQIYEKHFTKKELRNYHDVREWDETTQRYLTKEQKVSIALNWGNEGNRDRIRRGFNLDNAQVEKVLSTLTKRDFDFAQDVFDHLETYWPEVVAQELKLTGVEPKRVTPKTIETQHGNYPGGYYPISYDFLKSTDAYKNDLQKTELYRQFSAAKAHTDKGHTIERVSTLSRPIRLSFDVFHDHLDNVVHDLAFRKTVIDTQRFLNQRDVKTALENSIGIKGYKGFGDWLNSVAQDQTGNLSPADRAFQWFRFGTTLSVLGFRPIAIALHLPGNIVNAASEIGIINTTKVIGSALGNAVTGQGQLKQFVFEKSEMMNNRFLSRDRDFGDMQKRLKGSANPISQATLFTAHHAFFLLHAADQAVSVPLWAEVYKRNIDEHGPEKAKQIADEAIVRTLGNGSRVDQIGAQRGSEAMKMTTMFYSWMSVMFNKTWAGGKLAGLEYKESNFAKGNAVLLHALTYGIIVPGLLEASVRQVFTNNPNQTNEEAFAQFLGHLFSTPFNYVPGVRDIVPGVIKAAVGEDYIPNYSISPLENTIQVLHGTLVKGAQITFGHNKKFDENYVKDLAKAASILGRYPDQLNTWMFNFYDDMAKNGQATYKDILSKKQKQK